MDIRGLSSESNSNSNSNSNMTSGMDASTETNALKPINNSTISSPNPLLAPVPVPSTGPRTSIKLAITALSMLRLLQLPVRLTSPFVKAQVLPETFLFDGQRLSFFRDLVDIISVQVYTFFISHPLHLTPKVTGCIVLYCIALHCIELYCIVLDLF